MRKSKLLSVASLAVLAIGAANAQAGETQDGLVSVDVTNTQVSYVEEDQTTQT